MSPALKTMKIYPDPYTGLTKYLPKDEVEYLKSLDEKVRYQLR
jgi:hypothetical protein